MEKLGGLAENLASGKICGKSGGSCKAENLASGKSGKLDAENLRKNSLTGKSAESFRSMENLENLRILYSCGESAEKSIDWKICGESGKSGKSGSMEKLKIMQK
jgi:hypothetical protein